MPTSSPRPLPIFSQWLDLLAIELTNWRWSWRSLLITATLAPLASTLALGVFARDGGPAILAYVLTGNIVLALTFGNMGNVESHFAYIRFQGMLDYFASLPIRRSLVILAVVAAFFLLSLPSVLLTIGLGATVLQIPLRISPLIVLVIPLCALPLSGIGAMIGVTARTPEEGGALGLLLTLALTALGPVIVPPERLPVWLVQAGRLSPATYAASALRQTLLGPVGPRLLVDLLVLVGWSVLVFWAVGSRMDWRSR